MLLFSDSSTAALHDSELSPCLKQGWLYATFLLFGSPSHTVADGASVPEMTSFRSKSRKYCNNECSTCGYHYTHGAYYS